MNKILIEGALCLLPLLCGAAPAADIPYAETVPVIDGTMAPGEWRDAAILRKMELPGNPALPVEKSEIYLKYDNENLYVAIRAFESNPRGPEAYLRPWNDLLFKNDDAFQLVLGVSDPRLKTRDKIDMRVKLPTRFTFIIGTAKITYGSGFPGWGWTIRGNADPYGRGWIYQRVPLKSEEFAPLEIRLKKGVLNVFYDGQLVISDLALILPPTGNVFGIETWHTDCVEAEAGEIATELEGDRVFGKIHPVETLKQENK